jgi:hypothetical protein
MHTKYFLIILLLAFCQLSFSATFSVYEANYPDVKDYNVNVDTTKLDIVPHGAFVEMNLQLTISYDFESWFFKNYNELEFMWEFDLPDQASVTDFWIMLDDTLRQASMLDKWTAELLFSEVSSPVRNPALLTQSFPNREGQVHHQLRLYPVTRNVKRTFIIQYILPARPTNETLRAWLPTTQLTTRDFSGAKNLQITFNSSENPKILGAEILDQSFDSSQEQWAFNINLNYDQFVELVYPTPIKEKPFFSTFDQNGETFYQLAVYPPEKPQIKTPRNFLILIDFNRFNTIDLDGELVLSLLKETMQQALDEEDNANIIVGFENLAFGSNTFLPCTEENLDLLFNNVLRRSFPSYSSFQLLLAKAQSMIINNPYKTDIILLTNTDEIQLWGKTREQYAAEIVDLYPIGTKIHIVDLDNKSGLVYNNDTFQYETYMQSFYGHLANITAGNLFFLRYHSIKNIFAALFYEQISHFQEIEVQTRFAAGYAYGKHLVALHQGYYPIQFPIMQVGRFNGELPLDLTILGKIRLDKAIATSQITEADVVPGSEKLATAWYGDFLHEQLRLVQTNSTIMDIMDKSLKHHILTPYTGFLVFRPGEEMGVDPDKITSNQLDKGGDDGNYWDGGEGRGPATFVEDEENPTDFELAVKAYPNPFNMAVTIQIQIPNAYLLGELDFGIHNTLGQKVKSIEMATGINKFQMSWDGTSDNGDILSSGIYFAVLVGPDFRKSVKLMMIK